MRLLICSLVLLWPTFGQTFRDISEGWRFSTDDNPAFANPAFDDSHWIPVSLPLPSRPAGVAWLRQTLIAPAGANAIALGLQGPITVYIDGIQQRPLGGGVAQSVALPRETGGKVTIAIRLRRTRVGPNVVARDYGPFILGPAQWITSEVKLRNLAALRDRSPFFILAGIQLTLALVLALLYFATSRQYVSLLWIGGYLLYSGTNLLRNLDFPSTPAIPGMAGALLLQIVLSLSGWRAAWIRWTIGVICVSSLLSPALIRSPEWTAQLNNGLHITSLALIAVRFWQAPRSFEAVALAFCLGYILLPLYNSTFGRSGSLLLEAGGYYWPGLALVNVPVTFGLLVIWIRRFARDRSEKRRLAGELDAARTIQQLLFSAPGDGSVDAVYEPAHEVGGDFWQILPASDGARLIVIGDVSGKGLRAAMIVSLLSGALRNRRSDHPGEILTDLNRTVLSLGDAGFVTALAARIDRDGALDVANAGHLSPYLDRIECLLENGLPLGLDPDAHYPETRLQLLPGQQLTFVSDGVVEAANTQGELFGFERTREISTKPAAEIAEAARAWGQNDDITVVTVRRTSA